MKPYDEHRAIREALRRCGETPAVPEDPLAFQARLEALEAAAEVARQQRARMQDRIMRLEAVICAGANHETNETTGALHESR